MELRSWGCDPGPRSTWLVTLKKPISLSGAVSSSVIKNINASTHVGTCVSHDTYVTFKNETAHLTSKLVMSIRFSYWLLWMPGHMTWLRSPGRGGVFGDRFGNLWALAPLNLSAFGVSMTVRLSSECIPCLSEGCCSVWFCDLGQAVFLPIPQFSHL